MKFFFFFFNYYWRNQKLLLENCYHGKYWLKRRLDLQKAFSLSISLIVLYRFGLLVGRNPVKTIIVSLIFALLSLSGLVRFKEENRPEKLWVEQSSQYITDQNWVRQHFPTRIRYIRILLKGGDVLTQDGIRQVRLTFTTSMLVLVCSILSAVEMTKRESRADGNDFSSMCTFWISV